MILPDYAGNSLVNLMSSLGQAMGIQAGEYPVLDELPAEEIRDYQNIILLVIDGLGYEYLREFGHSSALYEHLRSRLTSVFPSTTASAITTFMTGQAPQQHALTGWFTYLKEVGCVTAVLPLRPRAALGGFNSNAIDVHRLYGHTPIFDLLDRKSYVVSPEWIIHSEYNTAHSGSALLHGYNTLEQCFQNMADIVRASQERKYVYAYWPDFDRYSHETGRSSKRVNEHFAELDQAFEKLLAKLAGTRSLLVVTADHGFINTAPQRVIQLADHKPLQDSLVLPLCGEPRSVYCYIHPHKQEQFTDYVTNALSEYVELKPSSDLIEEAYFGLGTPHAKLAERIGHYTLLMKENYVLKDQLPGESPFIHIGVHGGISSQEMYVPLVVATC